MRPGARHRRVRDGVRPRRRLGLAIQPGPEHQLLTLHPEPQPLLRRRRPRPVGHRRHHRADSVHVLGHVRRGRVRRELQPVPVERAIAFCHAPEPRRITLKSPTASSRSTGTTSTVDIPAAGDPLAIDRAQDPAASTANRPPPDRTSTSPPAADPDTHAEGQADPIRPRPRLREQHRRRSRGGHRDVGWRAQVARRIQGADRVLVGGRRGPVVSAIAGGGHGRREQAPVALHAVAGDARDRRWMRSRTGRRGCPGRSPRPPAPSERWEGSCPSRALRSDR